MPNYNQKGFGLIGVIVAILIVTVGLVGILTLASMSLKGASVSKMRLIASGLAQEGIEVVRDMRRSSIGSEWDNWYALISDGVYGVQYNSQCLDCCPDVWNLCPSALTTLLKLDKPSGLYQYISGNDSPFYRKVTLTKISVDEVKVVVEVKWQAKSDWHYLTAEDRLWNWR